MARLELAYFIPTVPFTMLFSPPHSYKLVLGTLEDTQVVLFLLQDGVRGAVRQLPKTWYVPPSEAHNVWLCLFVILLSTPTSTSGNSLVVQNVHSPFPSLCLHFQLQ